MDLRRLRYFVVLSETLHFGKAAERLSMAQPPLSQQIRVLEEEMGARLFERSNRRVELTPVGQALLPEARALLAQAEHTGRIAARVQRGEVGELRIGFTSASALTEVIQRIIFSYRKQWPGVRLRIEELTTLEQLTAMLDRRLDFAFVRSVQAPQLSAGFESRRLFEDALGVLVPQGHRLARGSQPISVEALGDDEFVTFPEESGVGIYEQTLSLCRSAGFSPKVVQEGRTAATIVGLVAAGLGVALVPASFQSIAAHGVVHRKLKDKAAKSAMWLVARSGRVPEHERRFREMAANAIGT